MRLHMEHKNIRLVPRIWLNADITTGPLEFDLPKRQDLMMQYTLKSVW
jgi:hypothetical protein